MKIATKDIIIRNRIRKRLEGIEELSANMKFFGLINPVSIFIGTKELKAGRRRVEAAKLLGWEEIDCRYVEYDVEASENLFREELTPEEKVKSVERLAEEIKGMARERQATSTGGKNPQLVANLPQSIERVSQKSREII